MSRPQTRTHAAPSSAGSETSSASNLFWGRNSFYQGIENQYGAIFRGNMPSAGPSRFEGFETSPGYSNSRRFYSSQSDGMRRDPPELVDLTQDDDLFKRDRGGNDFGGGQGASETVEDTFVREIYDMRTMVKNLRRWEHTEFGKLIGTSHDRRMIGDGVRFTVMNYNVLSQHMLRTHRQLYQSCDPRALDHVFRKQLFFSELDEMQPDIVTLQEVEETEFYRTLEPTLFLKGYKGVYKKRTGDKVDGCAIFYRATRFGYLDKLTVEFQQPHIPVLDRDNVALFLKLRCNNNGPGTPQTLIVGTTHILFNPKRTDVKLAQVQLLLTELDRFAFRGWDPETRDNIYYPLILAGDFNSDPHTPLVRFLTDGIYRSPGELSSSKSVKRKSKTGMTIPKYAGISDQCQHYKVLLERMNVWQSNKQVFFTINKTLEHALLNIKLSSSNVSSTKDFLEGTSTTKRVNFDPEDNVIAASASASQASPPNSAAPTNEPSTAEVSEVDYDDSLVSIKSFASNSVYSYHSQAPSSSTVEVGGLNNANHTLLLTAVDETQHAKILEELVEQEVECTFGTGDLSHGFKFCNVYASPLDRAILNDMGVTTKHVNWTNVDYIFYNKVWNKRYKKITEGSLRLVRRLGLLTRDECKRIGPIPNLANSSDHYCLVAEFVLK